MCSLLGHENHSNLVLRERNPKIRAGRQATFMDGKSVENSSLVAYTVLNQWKRVSSNCQMVKAYIMHRQNPLFGNKIFSIMSVTINQSIRRHVPEDLNLHQHNCQNLSVQGDSFGTRPKKMRISQRLFITF